MQIINCLLLIEIRLLRSRSKLFQIHFRFIWLTLNWFRRIKIFKLNLIILILYIRLPCLLSNRNSQKLQPNMKKNSETSSPESDPLRKKDLATTLCAWRTLLKNNNYQTKSFSMSKNCKESERNSQRRNSTIREY